MATNTVSKTQVGIKLTGVTVMDFASWLSQKTKYKFIIPSRYTHRHLHIIAPTALEPMEAMKAFQLALAQEDLELKVHDEFYVVTKDRRRNRTKAKDVTTKIDKHTRVIQTTELEQHLPEFFNQASFDLVAKKQVRFTQIEPDSLYAHLGFENEDVLSLNKPIKTTHEAILALFDLLNQNTKTEIQVKRQGKVQKLTFLKPKTQAKTTKSVVIQRTVSGA